MLPLTTTASDSVRLNVGYILNTVVENTGKCPSLSHSHVLALHVLGFGNISSLYRYYKVQNTYRQHALVSISINK